MKLIKAILLIILLFITFGCNDNKILQPGGFSICDENLFKEKYLIMNYGYYNNIILDYNYFLLVDSSLGFVFFDVYQFDKNNIKNKKEDYNVTYKDFLGVKVIEIDFKNLSKELFCANFEKYLNTTSYYQNDKLNIRKLNTIKKIVKEFIYVLEQNFYDKNYHKNTLATYHKGVILKNEYFMNNSIIWIYENTFNNNRYTVELSINDNQYKIKLKSDEK